MKRTGFIAAACAAHTYSEHHASSQIQIPIRLEGTKGAFEHYTGHISKFGVDIGYTQAGIMVWAVFAPASAPTSGALDGDYAGATASATVGVGVGANALAGGFQNSVALQPVSIEGNTGLNIAAGVAGLTLRYSD